MRLFNVINGCGQSIGIFNCASDFMTDEEVEKILDTVEVSDLLENKLSEEDAFMVLGMLEENNLERVFLTEIYTTF